MGDLFRSEEMALAQIFIQPEAAYFAISQLGEVGCAQFRDLNEDVNAFQRKFVNEVKRCDEMERRLRYIEQEVNKMQIKVPELVNMPKAPNPREMVELEAHLKKMEKDILEQSESAVKLKSNFLEVTELKHVLEKAQILFNEKNDDLVDHGIPEDAQDGQLGFITGVINRERMQGFERMLWRISRGNIFLRQADIEVPLEDPTTGNNIQKIVFVAFYQGEKLKSSILKICGGFRASIYTCPNSQKERQGMLKEVGIRILDLNMVLNQTTEQRERVLGSVAVELKSWTAMLSKMKAIFHTLNLFNVDVTKECLIGECWVPSKDISVVQEVLADSSKESSIPSFLNIMETFENPPTYNRTNKFTKGFQNLIDSYGIATYREANPALYTIVTFPFLFAVMFGDIGHAIIIALFATWMISAEVKITAQKNKSEIFSIFFEGRYIILLMGIYSVYTGFIYNDFFSKSLNVFGSSWHSETNITLINETALLQYDPKDMYAGTPYFMGLDPIWQLASANKIVFLNSFKMKLSIIFGVAHMIFGVCVSTINFIHFRKYSSLVFEFLPQVLFLLLLFFWMVIMIFIKWIKYSADEGVGIPLGTSCAPSVLIYFINMLLFKANPSKEHCYVFMFEEQDILQKILVFGALLCIPVMLLGKPLYIIYNRKRAAKAKALRQVSVTMNAEGLELDEVTHQKMHSAHHGEEEEEEPMSEIFIHQIIHTIEYVLSTVSHTASYLRLWALSLAHSQLSEVLWGRLFHLGLALDLQYIGGVFIFIFFAVWAFFTIAILVTMEGLSAFLHTLRLHWVEFMSKFYTGLGYQFEPFSFKAIIALENGED